MRTIILATIILATIILVSPSYLNGQKSNESTSFYSKNQKKLKENTTDVKHHNISINPLNICLFQQIGITYEYRPGKLGFGITPGYIYANNKAYSNWFIVGPTNLGSLGYYSGFFIVPQINVYLTELHGIDAGGVIYISLKFVYRNMSIDSARSTVWKNYGDGYYLYRKMSDKVNVCGGFIDFGFRYFLNHFFIDLNLGPGLMWVNHDMIVYGEKNGSTPDPIHYYNPPKEEKLYTMRITLNFTLNLGFAF